MARSDIRDSLQTRGGDADPSAPTRDEDAGAIITDATTRIVKAQELLAEAERLIDRADRLLNTSEIETREGRSFTRAVHADQRLEEESVDQLSSLRAQLSNRQCLLEGCSNFRFVVLLDPDQHEGWIAGLERTLRSLHDWTIQTVAVCERRFWHEREEAERQCRRDRF